jgi:CrcB protein
VWENLGKYSMIAVGGALGAMARYWVGGVVAARLGGSFPYGTLVVNATGSLVLGCFMAMAAERLLSSNWRLFVAIGFAGAYTTFSTFEYEMYMLIEEGSWLRAVANVVLSVGICFAALAGGIVLGRRI